MCPLHRIDLYTHGQQHDLNLEAWFSKCELVCLPSNNVPAVWCMHSKLNLHAAWYELANVDKTKQQQKSFDLIEAEWRIYASVN